MVRRLPASAFSLGMPGGEYGQYWLGAICLYYHAGLVCTVSAVQNICSV